MPKTGDAKPPRSKRRLTAARVAQALRDAQGAVTVAATTLGCSRKTIYRYVERYPAVKEALDDAREVVIDTAELKLKQAVTKGEPWAISMVLRTIGRHRGYIEAKEQRVSGNLGIDLSRLTDEQLEALAAGQPLESVVGG